MNIDDMDLNLLRALDVLVRERNVTRAGRALGLSQPAMSNALTRLRVLTGDPLLVRSPDGMLPTLTICRVILVSGRMEATTSTIWKRACLAVMIGFWPVMRIIGMAPRLA